MSVVDRGYEERQTSQLSKIKQRPPATDLSGPKASAESVTPRRSNLAVAYAVDFQFDFLSPAAALGSAVSSGWTSSCTLSETVEVTTLSEGTIKYSNRNQNVHVLLDSPAGGIKRTEGEG